MKNTLQDLGRLTVYSLSNYVPCIRADMPQGVQQSATALESLGFTVEHHKHAKGGAQKDAVIHCVTQANEATERALHSHLNSGRHAHTFRALINS